MSQHNATHEKKLQVLATVTCCCDYTTVTWKVLPSNAEKSSLMTKVSCDRTRTTFSSRPEKKVQKKAHDQNLLRQNSTNQKEMLVQARK